MELMASMVAARGSMAAHGITEDVAGVIEAAGTAAAGDVDPSEVIKGRADALPFFYRHR